MRQVGSTDLSDYRLRRFRGDNNITPDVVAGTYAFNLPPDHPRKFRLQIKAETMPGDACVGGEVHVLPEALSDGGYFQINSQTACS